jgi:hypothetical protein
VYKRCVPCVVLRIASQRKIRYAWQHGSVTYKIILSRTWSNFVERRQCKCNAIFKLNFETCGPGSSVGIPTGYGLDGPGIESRWGEIFHNCPDRPWGLPSLLYNGYRVFSGGRKRLGRDADPSPPSTAEV